MIIKQLNAITVNRVLPEQDAERLVNVDQYIADTKSKIRQSLQDTQVRIKQIEQDAYQQTVTKITETNAQMLADFENKLRDLLESLSEDLHAIIYRILVKIGITTSDNQRLKHLIDYELAKLTTVHNMKITANEQVIELLKNEFTESKPAFFWQIDNTLLDEECICATDIWIMRLDIASTKQQLANLLNST